MPLFPAATAVDRPGEGLEHVAVAVAPGSAVQTAKSVYLLYWVAPCQAVLGLVSGPLTHVAAVHPCAAIWAVVDLVTDLQSAYSSAGMANHVFTAVSSVAYSAAVHTAHLSAGITARIRHMAELPAVEALEYWTRVLEVASIRPELGHKVVLPCGLRLNHLLRSPLYAKQSRTIIIFQLRVEICALH